jgi:hypothetical protein
MRFNPYTQEDSVKKNITTFVCLLTLAILCLAGLNGTLFAQTLPGGTYQVGSSRAYSNLTAVADTLNTHTVTGNVVFELMDDYDGTSGETFPIAFTPFTTSGGNWTVTIRPASGVSLRTTSGSVSTNPLFKLNGVDRLTLDGRAGGTGSTIGWLIRDTVTTSASCAVQFINDATYDTLQYLQLESQNILQATVFFDSTTGAAGNDNNVIDHCLIRDRSDVSGTPACAIHSSGTSAKENSNNVVQNCDIMNFLQYGVSLVSNNTGWTISNNNFYCTTSGTSSTYVIYTYDGNGYTVSGNYLGGQTAACGGSAWTSSGNWYGIYLAQTSGTSSTVQGNTIQNIEITGSASFYGMYFNGGVATTGTGNTIGHASTSNSIQLAGQTNHAIFINAGTTTVQNNHIAHVTSTGTDNQTILRGIAGQLSTVAGNTIDHLSTASTKSLNISGNTFASASAALIGIYTAATTPNQIIENNTINDLSCTSSGTAFPALIAIGIDPSSTTSGTVQTNHIYNCTNLSLGAANAPSIIGVRTFNNNGSWTMANNMISLGNSSNTNNVRIYGIQEGGDTCWIYYNTILIGGSPTTGAATSAALNTYHPSTEITSKDNIFVNERSNSGSATGKHYAILKSANAPLISDFNILYANGTDGYVGTHDNETTIDTALTDWQTATSGDANSKSKAITFSSTTDLHLSGASIGDFDLTGTPIAGITTDYDGETRDAGFPYMGADENIASPLPVQCSALLATCKNTQSVELQWRTATEVDNFGFEIERSQVLSRQSSIGNLEWTRIGFVEGAGTSTSPREYSFVDRGVAPGRYSYRIKQIDRGGSFRYIGETEVEVGGVPHEFTLHQNYPNPFNPATTIEYDLPEEANVSLVVYDNLGRRVAELVNTHQQPGYYTATFDASHLTSGMYYYKLQAGDFVKVRKLILVK